MTKYLHENDDDEITKLGKCSRTYTGNRNETPSKSRSQNEGRVICIDCSHKQHKQRMRIEIGSGRHMYTRCVHVQRAGHFVPFN